MGTRAVSHLISLPPHDAQAWYTDGTCAGFASSDAPRRDRVPSALALLLIALGCVALGGALLVAARVLVTLDVRLDERVLDHQAASAVVTLALGEELVDGGG